MPNIFPPFNSTSNTLSGTIFALVLNQRIVIETPERIKYKISPNTSILDIQGNEISFDSLSINDFISITPNNTKFDTASIVTVLSAI
jgi:hypothetical protein